ncbi:MAG: hypothetical protein AAFV71_27395 [Cyanobacteria bacterium J06633_8]
MIYKIKTKLSSTISIIGFSLLISLITSCSSITPSEEIPPVAEGSELTNLTDGTSRKIRRDNREGYLKNVKKSLYEEDGITKSIIELNQRKNHIMTLDEVIFLVQACEYGNKQACDLIKSREIQF